MKRSGIVYGMSNKEYHSGPEISNSAISQACRSMAHYQEYTRSGSGIDPKVALDGNIIHCAVLEPMEFDKRYVVSPKFDMRTTLGKAGAAAFAEAANGREPISQEQYDMAHKAQENVFRNGLDWFGDGKPEVSIFWEDSESGLACRCRPDWLTDEIIVDVKSTEDCRHFAKSVIAYGYHRQAAFYLAGAKEAGLDIKTFQFLVIEKKAPYAFMRYTLNADFIAAGEREVRQALNNISMAEFTGEFSGYTEELQQLEAPSWMV